MKVYQKSLHFAVCIVILFSCVACTKEPSGNESDIYGYWVDPSDGNAYRTIQLGSQLWMTCNLNIGEMIDAGNDQLNNGIIEKYCYDNDPLMCGKYGGLYQWGEAMGYDTTESTQGICPAGWHIPSDSDWKILEMYLGMSGESAGELFWRGTDQGLLIRMTGETGFKAMPAGNRHFSGGFNQKGHKGYFWTSTTADDGHAWRRGVSPAEDGIYRSVNLKSFGFSVRCMKYE